MLKQEEKLKEIPELVAEVKKFISDNYQPTTDMLDADVHLTTMEIFYKLQFNFPGKIYEPSDLALWLLQLGFKIEEFGQMRPEWLLKSKLKTNSLL